MICKCKIAYFDKVKETTHLSVIQQIQHQKKMGMGGGVSRPFTTDRISFFGVSI